MIKITLRLIALLILLMAGVMGYMYLTQPDMPDVPPVPGSSLNTAPEKPAVKSAAVLPKSLAGANDKATLAAGRDRLFIKVGGSETGTIEIALFNDLAPKHVKRIEALARAGAYDNVVFHRVIGGFMAQTGDVQYGKRGASIANAGMGGSDQPNLKAEFSNRSFVKGVVGMARSNSPDSANSQFFIMVGDAPYLNGKYTVVGRVIAGQDVVDGLKKGDQAANGKVTSPDYMEKVTVKSAS